METPEEAAAKQAADEAKAAEEAAEKEEQAVQTEHQERSGLGRRVSAMEGKMDDFLSKMDERLDAMKPVALPAPNPAAALEDDQYLTGRDLTTFLDQRDERRSNEAAKYEKSYLKQVSVLGQTEELELHNEIRDEMMKNFNVRYSNDPVADAERNYLKATRSILKKAPEDKKPMPLKGDAPNAALGVGGSATPKEGEAKAPVLDDFAKDYIKRRGLKEDFVTKVLDEK